MDTAIRQAIGSRIRRISGLVSGPDRPFDSNNLDRNQGLRPALQEDWDLTYVIDHPSVLITPPSPERFFLSGVLLLC
jgi:hypothetical protein